MAWLSLFFGLILLGVAPEDTVITLGRCPVDSVSKIVAGNFLSTVDEQLLVIERMGKVRCHSPLGRANVDIYRLVVLDKKENGFQRLWQSEPLLGREAVDVGLTPESWTSGEFDGDSLREIMIIQGDSFSVVNFGPDSGSIKRFPFEGGIVVDALYADVDEDGIGELVTLHLRDDSTGKKWDIGVWEMGEGNLSPKGEPIELPAQEPGMRFSLLGSARLEDYPGAPAVIIGEYQTLKPSRYYVLYRAANDSFVVRDTPFPWKEWFSKEEVLASGTLSLFNIGDTLVGLGFFVPGSGSTQSFAALQDGEWRVLKPRLESSKLGGLWCIMDNKWLNLRQGRFYLYSQPPFFWR